MLRKSTTLRRFTVRLMSDMMSTLQWFVKMPKLVNVMIVPRRDCSRTPPRIRNMMEVPQDRGGPK
jgi:hypothetical protein